MLVNKIVNQKGVWLIWSCLQSGHLPVAIQDFPKTKKPFEINRRALIDSSGWQDSNLRPPGPKPGAITGLRYINNLKEKSAETKKPLNKN